MKIITGDFTYLRKETVETVSVRGVERGSSLVLYVQLYGNRQSTLRPYVRTVHSRAPVAVTNKQKDRPHYQIKSTIKFGQSFFENVPVQRFVCFTFPMNNF